MAERPRILLVCGSVRRGSTNRALLATVEELAPDAGVTTDLYEALGALPHFDPDEDRDPLPPAVADLRARLAAADALLVCTPEYAGDLPGSFKNLLDWTVGGIETVDLPSAWINVSASGSQAAGAHAALRTVLAYTGCAIVDEACAHVPVRRDDVGPDGTVASAEIRAAIEVSLAALRAAAAARVR